MHNIIIISGVSGSGKSFMIQRAIEKFDEIKQVPSITTRLRRKGIDESSSRIFFSREEFTTAEKAGDLFLINTVFGEKYAYSYSNVNTILKDGMTALLELRVHAIKQVKALYPNTFSIYVNIVENEMTSKIDNLRNNPELRTAESLAEQDEIKNNGKFVEDIDAIFHNNYDEASIDRFVKLINSIR